MYSLLLVIFCGSILLILHTYLFYPAGMMLFFSKRQHPGPEFLNTDELPPIAILVAAYNEERVIGQKIDSVFNTTYPLSKIKMYVGSDASTDATEKIIEACQQKYAGLQLVKFGGRVGKIGIVNHLQSLAKEELLILTDANVMFAPNTIFELVKKFKDNGTGLVAANIIKVSPDDEGISLAEKKYLSVENKIKACESNGFKLVMGAEGGCYAIRNHLFTKVPAHFIVDDFFITLSVLNKNGSALFNPQALCSEDVANDPKGEYRRKVRISSGNFQNIFFFKKNLFQFWRPLCFAFWSHKVLRWLTPFLLLMALIISGLLVKYNHLFLILFVLQIAGLLIPLFNKLFNFKNQALKLVSHFYLMNFALFEGFIKFTGGIKTSIWQPIKRDV